jgi:toxin-antitoxin system PIN domain toxin
MKCIVDANVVLPLLLDGHPHRGAAEIWWNEQADENVLFTLPVRMAVLRLLSNTRVMGSGVLPPAQAWQALADLLSDIRSVSVDEQPAGLNDYWADFVRGRQPTPNVWTDAWLAAYAEAGALELVTFDRGFRSFKLAHLRLLTT